MRRCFLVPAVFEFGVVFQGLHFSTLHSFTFFYPYIRVLQCSVCLDMPRTVLVQVG